jgi:hypothetical protein
MRSKAHRASRLAAVLVATVALVALAAPVTAASPQPVTIVSNVTFNPDGPNYGDFSASGPAVDSGTICAAGTFVDTALSFAGYQGRPGHIQIGVAKEFTCDGGGTFAIRLRINADSNTGIESFSWVASGEPGPYATLRGTGLGSTVPTETGNINTYQGFFLH